MSIISEQNERNSKIRLDLIRMSKDIESKIENLRSEQGVYERKQEFVNASTIEAVALGYDIALCEIKKVLNGEY